MAGLSDRGAAIVTAAAWGIGQSIAWALAERGFQLVLTATDSSDLAATRDGVEARGAGCVALSCNVADLSARASLLAAATDAFGIPACLVNNAGADPRPADLLEVVPESFDRVIAVNLRGTFFLTQAMARLMLAEPPDDRFRSIITLSSANAAAASADRAGYCLADSALGMMTALFALRLAEAGIHAYEVRTGFIETPAMNGVSDGRDGAVHTDGDIAPIDRFGRPREVADAVATLASGGLPFATGETIRVDGGLHIARL